MDQNSAAGAVGIVLFMIAAIVAIALSVLYVVSIIWSYRDAEKRGKSGCLVAILVAFLSWPLGLVIWLVARPNDRQ